MLKMMFKIKNNIALVQEVDLLPPVKQDVVGYKPEQQSSLSHILHLKLLRDPFFKFPITLWNTLQMQVQQANTLEKSKT